LFNCEDLSNLNKFVFSVTLSFGFLKHHQFQVFEKNWNERTGQFRVFEKAKSKNWLILDVINPQRTAGFQERTAGSLLVLCWSFAGSFRLFFLLGRSWGQVPENVSDRREDISNFGLSQIYTYLSCQSIPRHLAVNKRSTKHRLFCKLQYILNHI
jgi:hypothetical protein